MADKILFSIIESATHPDFSHLYKKLDLREERLFSARKVINAMKQQPPDFIIAEFFMVTATTMPGLISVIWMSYSTVCKNFHQMRGASCWWTNLNASMSIN